MASVDASTKASANLQNCKIISSEPLNSNEARWTKLTKIHYQDPLGRRRDWEAAERSTRSAGAAIDGVGVIALLQPPPGSTSSGANSGPDGPLVVLQKQFRPPVGRVCVEIPAGLLDAGERPETCAVRELKEETGYDGKAVSGGAAGWSGSGTAESEEDGGKISGVLFNDPGFTNTNLAFVHAAVNPSLPANAPGAQKPELEDNEFIHTFTVPLGRLWTECRRLESEGCAVDARVGALAEGIELAKAFKL